MIFCGDIDVPEEIAVLAVRWACIDDLFFPVPHPTHYGVRVSERAAVLQTHWLPEARVSSVSYKHSLYVQLTMHNKQ